MSDQVGRISNGVTFIALWVYVCALALAILVTMAFIAKWTETNERNGSVGRSVGYAVGEHHQLMTHITSDPTENYLIPATPEP